MSRKRNPEREGFIPREEAVRKDDIWANTETDLVLDWILENGDSPNQFRMLAKVLNRSSKACKREWQLHLYQCEEHTKVFTYVPSSVVRPRTGQHFHLSERKLIAAHQKTTDKDGDTVAPVPIAITARMCRRLEKEIAAFLKGGRIAKPMILT